jgi:K+-sensing histidine kinase KdpD
MLTRLQSSEAGRTRPRFPTVRVVALATAALLLSTVGMLAIRPILAEVHVALILLLVVLGGSAAGGRLLGLALAAAAFVVFDVFFVPPYNTLVVANPLDWLVLFAFLTTSVVAAQLLYRAQEEARVAHERAAEIDRLATLGAETLTVAQAADALAAIADVIRSSVGAARCDILIRSPSGFTVAADSQSGTAARRLEPLEELARDVSERGVAAVERRAGTTHLAAARPTENELAL